MEWLDRHFAGRLISGRRIPEWSLYSPDLNPLDFYLWRFLKDHIYQMNSQTITELKKAITQQTSDIAREECVRVIDNFVRRPQVIYQGRGAHLEHFL